MRRNVSVYDALIAEGFVAYASTVAADDPLFRDKKPDKYGQRGGRAWNVVSKWVPAAWASQIRRRRPTIPGAIASRMN